MATALFKKTARAALYLFIASFIAYPSVHATTVVAPDFNTLVRDSDYVVRAVVKSVTYTEKAKPGKRSLPYSLVELQVTEVIVGTPPSPLVLEVLGGRTGDREMHISGAPKFEVGQDSILFVQGNKTQIFPLTRMMHGLYPVVKDKDTGKEYITRSNGEPMTSTAEVSQPMHDHDTTPEERRQMAGRALTATDFATQIRTANKENKADAK